MVAVVMAENDIRHPHAGIDDAFAKFIPPSYLNGVNGAKGKSSRNFTFSTVNRIKNLIYCEKYI